MEVEENSGKGRMPAEQPVFWKEVYWLALICLGGWVLAVWVLSPRLARDRSSRDAERGLEQTVQQLEMLQGEYEAAIVAVENDVFYRDEVYRNILKVKRDGEEFLKKEVPVSDN
jgi:hypothetical protein